MAACVKTIFSGVVSTLNFTGDARRADRGAPPFGDVIRAEVGARRALTSELPKRLEELFGVCNFSAADPGRFQSKFGGIHSAFGSFEPSAVTSAGTAGCCEV